MQQRILLVDDEGGFRTSLAAYLRRSGHHVWTAEDVDAAMMLAVEVRPDVLVIDWMLKSHSDGLDITDALRHAGVRPRVIVISGYPSEQLRRKLEAMPQVTFLAKPFPPQELLAELEGSSDGGEGWR